MGAGNAVLRAFHDDIDVDEPEQGEAERRTEGETRPRRVQRSEKTVDGGASDPRLDPEPSAGDGRAQERGDVRAVHAEGDPGQDGKRDSEPGARVRVQNHGHEHDQVPEGDGEDRLPPVHPALDETGGEHVGREIDRESHPERGDVVGAPRPFADAGRREVPVVGTRVERLLRAELKKLIGAPAHLESGVIAHFAAGG